MATVHVTMGHVFSKDGIALFYANSSRYEAISSGVSSVTGALVAGAADPTIKFEVAKVECDTAVVATAKSPATTSNGVYVKAGGEAYIVLMKGESVSVIDA